MVSDGAGAAAEETVTPSSEPKTSDKSSSRKDRSPSVPRRKRFKQRRTSALLQTGLINGPLVSVTRAVITHERKTGSSVGTVDDKREVEDYITFANEYDDDSSRAR